MIPAMFMETVVPGWCVARWAKGLFRPASE